MRCLVPNAASVRMISMSDKMWLMPKVQPNSRHAVTACGTGVVEAEAGSMPSSRDRPDRYADQSEQLMVHHSGPPE